MDSLLTLVLGTGEPHFEASSSLKCYCIMFNRKVTQKTYWQMFYTEIIRFISRVAHILAKVKGEQG